MYADHFGFRGLPFNVAVSPGVLYPGKALLDAHDGLIRSIDAGLTGLLVTGAPGIGKTTLLGKLQASLEGRGCTVVRPEIPAVRADSMETRFSAHVERALVQAAAASGPATDVRTAAVLPDGLVIMVDDADWLQDGDLIALRERVSASRARGVRVTLVLAGTPALQTRLQGLEPAGREATMDFMCRMRPMDVGEVDVYIRHKLASVGHSGPALFDPAAVALIVHFSLGIAKRVDTICGMALLIACEAGRSSVCAEIVAEAIEDLEGTPGELTRPGGPAVVSSRAEAPLENPLSIHGVSVRRTLSGAGRVLLTASSNASRVGKGVYHASRDVLGGVRHRRAERRRRRSPGGRAGSDYGYPPAYPLVPFKERDYLILKVAFIGALAIPAVVVVIMMMSSVSDDSTNGTASDLARMQATPGTPAAPAGARPHDDLAGVAALSAENRRLHAELMKALSSLSDKDDVIEEQSARIAGLHEQVAAATAGALEREPVMTSARRSVPSDPSSSGSKPRIGRQIGDAADAASARGPDRRTVLAAGSTDGPPGKRSAAGDASHDSTLDVPVQLAGSRARRASSSNHDLTHTVVAGDTLYAIARRFNVTVADLRQWNALASDRLHIGQSIHVAPRMHRRPRPGTELVSAVMSAER